MRQVDTRLKNRGVVVSPDSDSHCLILSDSIKKRVNKNPQRNCQRMVPLHREIFR